MSDTITEHHALIDGILHLKTAAFFDLYALLISRHQAGFNAVSRTSVHKIIPGLHNKKQRDRVLDILNSLVAITAEETPRHVKIFEYVRYENAQYSFELTQQAYPYYYPLYFIFGRHPTLPRNLFLLHFHNHKIISITQRRRQLHLRLSISIINKTAFRLHNLRFS